MKKELLEKIYPIGSLFYYIDDTDPSTILGGGKWKLLLESDTTIIDNLVGNFNYYYTWLRIG